MSDLNNSLLVNNESDENNLDNSLPFGSGSLLRSFSLSRSLASISPASSFPKRKSSM